ncbi:glycerate kinase [Aquitalea sp. LB_tupeE]|uniref:glycerate kinase n=1 Tax=Aquitalea sp. LB_tupeE TaxID=2748078 RepID=UPI0015BCE3AF|nr:glycerate kinase [Aquitalea sp. LB_tupeE]NWK76792.1 glycerate kinase [Aquitalea sp. LB_tupeE]
MRWVLAPDSFKGSLEAAEVAKAMQQGIARADPHAECVLRPMADGGEGTLDALHAAVGGQWLHYSVCDANGLEQSVACLLLPDGTAVMEVARIIGLPNAGSTPVTQRSSRGVGQLLQALLADGYRQIAVALGGSSTNDAGAGCLVALGLQLLGVQGERLQGSLQDVLDFETLSCDALPGRLAQVKLEVWSDVENPLAGEQGATAVFGPQKGVAATDIARFDARIAYFSKLLDAGMETSVCDLPGSGAAGGLGYALQLLGGQMVSGAKAVASHIGLATAVAEADWVLTGEGRSDSQTLSGKAPACVATLAKSAGVPVSLLSGAVIADDAGRLAATFNGCYSLCNRPMTLDVAMQEAAHLIASQAEQLARTILAAHA